MYADVLIELKARNLDKTFTYLVPDAFSNLKVGMRVHVPFGHQSLEGFVLKIHNQKPNYELKAIDNLIDDHPVLNSELLALGEYISKKTMTPLIAAYQTMLPNALKAHHDFVVNKKYEAHLYLIDQTYEPQNNKQQQIIALAKQESLKQEATKLSISSVNTLLTKGVIGIKNNEIYRLNDHDTYLDHKVILNAEQQNALKVIDNLLECFRPILLHGVTGSGKTEIYMHAIKEVIDKGKEAIVLVPEISLTPQLVSRFKARFGNDIAVLHSRLSSGEKYDEWRKIERGEVKIVIGARSAIFAPFQNLGLIVIDEEHSTTYKQENTPRYNAIDVALWRAKRYKCPVILGSATPSIEAYTRAKLGVYELIELKTRVNHNMPKVSLVDMKEEYKKGNRVLSELLTTKIQERLNNKEQVMILLNRRGYTTIITCKQCGFVMKCPNCDIPLTYHKVSNLMRCHYCGYQSKRLDSCPNCHSHDIFDYGMGTQKLEEIIQATFKGARLLRMDMDSTSGKGKHEAIIKAFEQNEADILIGTQMISKGLDFPNVTLVGVLNGDASLNIPDFRSSERTYQLLNQVAGRSGRSTKEGEVIIQAFNIDNKAIQYACHNNYEAFYRDEMLIRKQLKYPPYCDLCLIKVESKDQALLIDEANKLAKYLTNQLKQSIVLGPSATNTPKLNQVYSLQIIIKYKQRQTIKDTILFIRNKYSDNHKITLDIDFNPLRL